MLEIPNLPNDNLYKFLAFAGLALIIASQFFYYTKSYEYTVALSKYVADQSSLIDTASETNRWYEEVEARLSRFKPTEKTASSELDIIKQRFAEARERKIKDKQAAHDLDWRNTELELQKGQVELIGDLYYAGTTIGIFMMLVGMALWYVRVQRPQDQILKDQISKYRRRPPRLRV